MLVDAFDFDLPPDRIAQRPMQPRDAARLLEVAHTLADRNMRHLPVLLRPGDLLVVNDTRVIPARLIGRRGDVKIEITLHRKAGSDSWWAFAKPGRRLRIGDRVDFAAAFSAEIVEKCADGQVRLRFGDAARLPELLQRHGHMPLPPYIRRDIRLDCGPDGCDSRDYQTPFAAKDGAVAAPTAGLHFTDRLLAALEDRGIGLIAVTLHVGAGTFLPVKVADTSEHKMHSETGEIDRAAAGHINAVRAAGGRIVAVGSTALRLLETTAAADGHVHPFSGSTDLFITPGYRFRVVDLMLTNFHLPRSTLFMLVCAFAGLERMHAAYAHARDTGYRFFSYGDGCLLHRRDTA